MKVRVFDIIYSIEPEDLEDSSTTVRDIVASLPSILFLEVDSEDDLADAISDRTGWLVEGFEIDVM